ncbi:centromere protein P [Genypterus blacodes]|uniref:centromere protein P n=1 Tax=Genypterus blacodes TaxID=154954 RepID=UPI003F761357
MTKRIENMGEVKLWEDLVECLQAEVAALQHKQQHNRKDVALHFTGPMEDALWYVCHQRGGGQPRQGKENFHSRLKEEVEQMEEDLNQQILINGLSLTSCSSNTVQSGVGQLVQQLYVTGCSSELAVQVEFQLSQVHDGQRSERTISSLNIVVNQNVLQNVSFLSRVEESRDLLLFFRTLRTFSQRCNDRHQTFQHFQRKYPSIICLSEGNKSNVMTLQHSQLSSLSLLVHWSVEVSREGGVTPKIDLVPKIPRTALKMISQGKDHTAEAFQSLLRTLGPEAAVESVIRILKLSQDIQQTFSAQNV